ncbi:hypothetical protein EK904_005117 [Melospiza melodia maxima]|nr:hypothetical protein EK904_005117 [Melospiza melodia maxima]
MVTNCGSGFAEKQMGRTLEELISQFEVSRITTHSALLDLEALPEFNRIHLSRHIENQGLRQKLVRELQGLVELVYGQQQVDPDVLEEQYVERVLLLRKGHISLLKDLVSSGYSYLWVRPSVSRQQLQTISAEVDKIGKLVSGLLTRPAAALTVEDLNRELRSVQKQTRETKYSSMMQLLRLALSGQQHGPSVAEMMVTLGAEEKALEQRQQRDEATDPSVSEENWECIQRFCEQVNAATEGPWFALRLLAHKIQSPQEGEALHALTVLETCVNNCGDRFHSEMAKFRFLNELIKVLSPKYYGIWSSEKVKSRVTEVIFSWTVWFPQEVKIQDAYQMLKKQGIVKEDPKLPEDKILPPPSPRPQNSIFDTDEEKSKLLARLLRSSRPADLQAANRLIQSAVKEEQEKSAQVSRRVNTIREVSENVRRMDEFLESYRRGELSPGDQESLQVNALFPPVLEEPPLQEAQAEVWVCGVLSSAVFPQALLQRCERLRPLLFRLASEAVPDEEALAEVLQANDQLSWALGQYRQAVASQEDGDGAGSAASSARAPACRAAPRRTRSYTLIDFSELEAVAQTAPEPSADTASAPRHGSTSSSCLLEEQLHSLGLCVHFGATLLTGVWGLQSREGTFGFSISPKRKWGLPDGGLSNSPVTQEPPPDFGLAEAVVHNGFRDGVSAAQSLAPQQGWEDSCAGKSELQSLDKQLSPPPRSKTFSL